MEHRTEKHLLAPIPGWEAFPRPWTVEAVDAGAFKIVDGNKQTIAHVYGHADPHANGLTLDEARRIASNIAKLPTLLGKG